ncbi:MAG: TldD/PmbA family protein [Pyrinomonadaceae bacterium]|nr:TldD/PmbA family protein [Pyrinomonadaceae bacterium]
MQDYKNLATEIIAEFKKQGVDACDVYIVNGSQFNSTIRLGQIEKLQQSISKGLGMRIFKNDATALTYTTDFTDKSVKNLVKETMEIVKVSGADKFNGLAPKEFLGTYNGNLMLFDESLAKLTPEKKIEMAKAAEDAGRSFDKRITNTRGTNWFDGAFQLTLANSDGFVGQYKSTTASLNVNLMAEENGIKQTDGWFTFNRFVNKLDSPKAVGEEAARRTIAKLGGKKVKSQTAPIVIDRLVASQIVGWVFGAASGRSIYRKSSFLVDKIGTDIASPLISIMDDATIADGPASRPFDAEGVKSSQVSVVENGILKNYVCDAYSARRLNLKPSGNAARSYQSNPGVGSTNLYIKNGASDPKEIIKGVKSGLYVTSLFGFGFNGVTGDVSQGANGFWIENGELTYPVQEITLAGNLLKLLKNITMVGNDLSFKFGGSASPTLLISEATIGGA